MKPIKPRYFGTPSLDQSTIDSITQLKDGRSLTLTFSESSDTTIRTYRNKIYAYLNRFGIKQFFRLYLEGKNEIPNILRIKRLGQQFKTTFLQTSDEERIIDWVIDNLDNFNSIKDSDKVILSITEAIHLNILKETDLLKAHESWKETILGISESNLESSKSFQALEQVLERDKSKGDSSK